MKYSPRDCLELPVGHGVSAAVASPSGREAFQLRVPLLDAVLEAGLRPLLVSHVLYHHYQYFRSDST